MSNPFISEFVVIKDLAGLIDRVGPTVARMMQSGSSIDEMMEVTGNDFMEYEELVQELISAFRANGRFNGAE